MQSHTCCKNTKKTEQKVQNSEDGKVSKSIEPLIFLYTCFLEEFCGYFLISFCCIVFHFAHLYFRFLICLPFGLIFLLALLYYNVCTFELHSCFVVLYLSSQHFVFFVFFPHIYLFNVQTGVGPCLNRGGEGAHSFSPDIMRQQVLIQ